MVYTLSVNVTVVTAGTPVRLASSRTAASWVLIQALDNNTGNIYAGGSIPTAKQSPGVLASARRGIILVPGASMFYPSVVSTTSVYDLHEMWIDAATSGDGVSITYAIM